MKMNQSEKLKKEIEDKSNELFSKAEEVVIPLNDDISYHHRYFLVDLYAENTEMSGCLGFLAQIAKWFRVRPLTKKEVNKLG